MRCSRKNASVSRSLEYTEAPTTTTLPPCAPCSSSRAWTSSRHGPHHVAQKFRTTTLPRSFRSATVSFPKMSLSENPGAWRGEGRGGPAAARAGEAAASAESNPTTTHARAAAVIPAPCPARIAPGADPFYRGPADVHGFRYEEENRSLLAGSS